MGEMKIQDFNWKVTGSDNTGWQYNELASYLGIKPEDLNQIYQNVKFGEGGEISLEDLIEKLDEKSVPENGDEAVGKALTEEKLLKALKGKISKETDPTKQKALKEAAIQAEKELKSYLTSLSTKTGLTEDQQAKLQPLFSTYAAKSGDGAEDPSTPSPFKGQGLPGTPTGYGTNPSGTGGGTGGTGGTGGAGKGMGYDGFTNPGDMGTGFKAFDWTMYNDSAVLEAYDIIGEQQKRQQMMMLFFYYARMAMSGDIGAMYQFMRFISFVIARDKALQNVWMGTKLIELQDTSRKATQRLLAQKVGEDPESQAEWTKELQKIKSEENIVATSQKLISQMMEEFTQIVEMLTNVQKSLLDSQGKVLSNLSVWR
jgi:hypothetical protein